MFLLPDTNQIADTFNGSFNYCTATLALGYYKQTLLMLLLCYIFYSYKSSSI